MVTVQKVVVITTVLGKPPKQFQKGVKNTRKDISSHFHKHSIKTGHQMLEINDYRIIENGSEIYYDEV